MTEEDCVETFRLGSIYSIACLIAGHFFGIVTLYSLCSFSRVHASEGLYDHWPLFHHLLKDLYLALPKSLLLLTTSVVLFGLHITFGFSPGWHGYRDSLKSWGGTSSNKMDETSMKRKREDEDEEEQS